METCINGRVGGADPVDHSVRHVPISHDEVGTGLAYKPSAALTRQFLTLPAPYPLAHYSGLF